jgi:hypothetical protein
LAERRLVEIDAEATKVGAILQEMAMRREQQGASDESYGNGGRRHERGTEIGPLGVRICAEWQSPTGLNAGGLFGRSADGH